MLAICPSYASTMRAKASTYGSVSVVLLIAGLAMIVGSDDSLLLIVVGTLVVAAGVMGFANGVVLHFRAVNAAH